MTLVESAKKFALGRIKHINDFGNTSKVKVKDLENIKITMNDFK